MLGPKVLVIDSPCIEYGIFREYTCNIYHLILTQEQIKPVSQIRVLASTLTCMIPVSYHPKMTTYNTL